MISITIKGLKSDKAPMLAKDIQDMITMRGQRVRLYSFNPLITPDPTDAQKDQMEAAISNPNLTESLDVLIVVRED